MFDRTITTKIDKFKKFKALHLTQKLSKSIEISVVNALDYFNNVYKFQVIRRSFKNVGH